MFKQRKIALGLESELVGSLGIAAAVHHAHHATGLVVHQQCLQSCQQGWRANSRGNRPNHLLLPSQTTGGPIEGTSFIF